MMPHAAAPLAMGSPHAQAWAQATELEKRLRAESKKRSFWDPEVRRLRLALQHAYEAIIFSNYDFAMSNEVEQLLWKSVHYRPIEEFRNRLRIASQAVQQQQQQQQLQRGVRQGGLPATAGSAAGTEGGADVAMQQQKLMAAYLKFLGESVGFYQRLVWKLQWVWGSVGAPVQLQPSVQEELAQAAAASGLVQLHGSRNIAPLVHKCLVYLGDLNRYHATALKGSSAEWQRAIAWYRAAALALPSSGNPFNQLAVMSFQSGDELRAVYFYFRSLGVAQPFTTARENLLLLFERNRAKYQQLLPTLQGRTSATPTAMLPGDLAVTFVRLAGLQYDRINLEQYGTAADVAFGCLARSLADASTRQQLQQAQAFDHFPLHLAVLAAYCLHCLAAIGGNASSTAAGGPLATSASAPAPGRPPSVSGSPVATARSHAVCLALRLGAVLATAAAGTPWLQQGHSALLVGVHVLLQLLMVQVRLLLAVATGADTAALAGSGPGAGAGGGADGEEIVRLVELCGAASRLVEHLHAAAARLGFNLHLSSSHQQGSAATAAAGAGAAGSGHSTGAILGPTPQNFDAVLDRLPEDEELKGFEPLAATAAEAACMPGVAAGAQAEAVARARRIVVLLRRLCEGLTQGQGPDHAAAVASAPFSRVALVSRAVSQLQAALDGGGAVGNDQAPQGPPARTTGLWTAHHELCRCGCGDAQRAAAPGPTRSTAAVVPPRFAAGPLGRAAVRSCNVCSSRHCCRASWWP